MLRDKLQTRRLPPESVLAVLGDLNTDTWVTNVSAWPQTSSGLNVKIDLCRLRLCSPGKSRLYQ